MRRAPPQPAQPAHQAPAASRRPQTAPPHQPRPTGPPSASGHRTARRRNAQPRRHGKNGTPTLDLVELKDMSIQKLNQVAKDLGSPAPPVCASRS